MNKFSLSLVATALATLLAGCGGDGSSGTGGTAQGMPVASSFSVAVFGDVPYGTDLAAFNAMPKFIQAINADKDIRLAMHGGDLHSGSEPCTEAYDKAIARFFTQFSMPLVYAPGDNEWADCQKSKQMNGKYSVASSELGYAANTAIASYANGNPVDNLQLIRGLFFAKPGQTLGGGTKTLHTQAQDGANASDRQFVENVWWMDSGVLFVAVNIPGGSNNGTDPWWGAASATPQQQQEAAARTAATKNWLTTAFDQAQAGGATAVVILTQADMWDADGKPISHLTEYKQYIDLIAERTGKFAKPVLLLNGDSHVFRSDNPLLKGAACVIEPVAADGTTSGAAAQACSTDPYANNQPGSTYNVANFRRVVFHGSTMPLEWLKLKVDPATNAPAGAYAFGPFSWERKVVK